MLLLNKLIQEKTKASFFISKKWFMSEPIFLDKEPHVQELHNTLDKHLCECAKALGWLSVNSCTNFECLLIKTSQEDKRL